MEVRGRKCWKTGKCCTVRDFMTLYASPYIARLSKSRRLRWVGHVACMGDMRNLFKMLVGSPKGKDHSQDEGLGGRIILEWMLMK